LWESLLILSGQDPEGRWMEALLGMDEAGVVEAWGWGADEPGREGEGGKEAERNCWREGFLSSRA